MQSHRLQLFTLGFLTLFLELVLIRYLSGNIWNLGYFPNLILLAVFMGMGIGFSFHSYADSARSHRLFRLAFSFLVLLILFATVGHPTIPGFYESKADFGGDLYFTARESNPVSIGLIMLALWFLATLAIFALISQRTAKLFREFTPLTAYTLDIAGSCCGILLFMAISHFQISAYVWFLMVIPMYFLASDAGQLKSWRQTLPTLAGLLFCALLAGFQDAKVFSENSHTLSEVDVRWSPYQKIKYRRTKDDWQVIFANGIPHQNILTLPDIRSQFYQVPYDARAKRHDLPAYRNVLVLGAGSGNDVSAALANGVRHVDAVEIDPAIAEIGRRHHTAHPYQDPRTTLNIDDGRAFMARTKRKYDLIVFALTDSVVKVSPVGQLRLENYLFTQEAIARAKSLLTPDGDLLLYNSYRRPWLTAKIEQTVWKGSGFYPVRLWEKNDFVVMAAGRNNQRLVNPANIPSVDVAHDDWPFLYLKQRGIPMPYLWTIFAFMVLFGVFGYLLQTGEKTRTQGHLTTKAAFFLMGVAFLLLETKSVIQFALLFGTTWVNNSLVFLGVLLSVLLANWTARFVKGASHGWIYALLMGSCLIPFFVPLSQLLHFASFWGRFALASLVTFSPIYFANLIFSLVFREQEYPEQIFGWNLLGAAFGGLVEYFSLALGYRALALVVVIGYSGVFLLLAARKAQASSRTLAPASS